MNEVSESCRRHVVKACYFLVVTVALNLLLLVKGKHSKSICYTIEYIVTEIGISYGVTIWSRFDVLYLLHTFMLS